MLLLFFKLWLVISTLENSAKDRSRESTKTMNIDESRNYLPPRYCLLYMSDTVGIGMDCAGKCN